MPDADVLADISLADLTLHYQPQMTADGGRVAAVEALLRLARPVAPGIGPAEVLRRFAALDQEEALDWWVFRTACRDALRWPGISVAVNLTAGRFRDPGFAARLALAAAEIGIPPQRVELEIVESAYIDDFETAVANIVSLREKGFRIALDDFGTGFSSLTYLLKLPVDKVKIDKSFVDGVEFVRSAAIVHAIVALARALGLKVTAEGVETVEQQRFLKLAGCHYLQGWLFHQALDAEALSRLLAAETGR